MELKKIGHKLTVCKVTDITNIDLTADFYFIGKTDEELSLVCKTEDTPIKALERDDGWRGFRIQGVLDFFAYRDSLKTFRDSCRTQNRNLRCFNL